MILDKPFKYLYLLPFKDGKHFKIGIGANNLNRVNQNNSTYGIEFNEAYIFIAQQNKMIRSLETELLCLAKELNNNPFKGADGYTEIRHISDLPMIINHLVSKPESLKVKSYKYQSFLDEYFTQKIAGASKVAVKKPLSDLNKLALLVRNFILNSTKNNLIVSDSSLFVDISLDTILDFIYSSETISKYDLDIEEILDETSFNFRLVINSKLYSGSFNLFLNYCYTYKNNIRYYRLGVNYNLFKNISTGRGFVINTDVKYSNATKYLL